MPAYRIEIASTGRAGCNATHCKKNNVKIVKGEMRQGVWVDYEDRGSYKWRHWGCITPEVLHNWHEASEGQTDLIDGFDELPEEAQAKLKRALEQGHVDDEEWNGDIECNRWTGGKGMGMFVKGAAKKQKEAQKADADTNGAAAPTKKPTGRKRKAAKDELDEDEELPKKSKGKGKKAKADVDEHEEVETSPPKRSRVKKAKIQDDDGAKSTPAKAPATKKSRSKKTAPAEEVGEAEEEDEVLEPVPKSKSKSKPKPKPQTVNTKRGKKVVKDDGEDVAKAAAKPQKRKTKSTRAAAAEED
nr:parp-type zinc finger-containing protein c2a9.07c [Quercus suber]